MVFGILIKLSVDSLVVQQDSAVRFYIVLASLSVLYSGSV